MEQQEEPKQEFEELPTTYKLPDQRIMIGIFAFVFVTALVLGFRSIALSVKTPFKPLSQSSSLSSQNLGLKTEEQSRDALRNSDIDGDGLSDYDEINTYRTSMFLKDSDSDGYTDDVELKSGYDPNCPSGQVCASSGFDASAFAFPKKEVLSPDATALEAPLKATGEELKIDIPEFGGSFTIDQLREMPIERIRAVLLQKGMPSDELGKIDDATLREIYIKSLSEAASRAAKTPEFQELSSPRSLSQGTNGETFDPEALSASEIRALILESGKMTQEQLNALDDATVKDLFVKAAVQAKQQQ